MKIVQQLRSLHGAVSYLPYVVFPAVASLLLYVRHRNLMVVDEVTIAVLFMACLPWIAKSVHSFKAIGIEIGFKDLQERQQVIMFLDGVARKADWTFYPPRPSDERELGAAFGALVRDVYTRHPSELCRKISEWTISDDPHLRWFAAEVIGHLKIKQLVHKLPEVSIPSSADDDDPLEAWLLNSMWARSRFEKNYDTLQRFLMHTRQEKNQRWILLAYLQMVGVNQADPGVIHEYVEQFVAAQANASEKVLTAAREVLALSGEKRNEATERGRNG